MQENNIFGSVLSDIPEFKGMPYLPTWVPNLTSFYAQWTLGLDSRHLARNPSPYFFASGEWPPEIHSLTDSQLAVSGMVVNVVKAVARGTPIVGV